MTANDAFALVRQRLVSGFAVKLHVGHADYLDRENVKITISNNRTPDSARTSTVIKRAIQSIEQSCSYCHVVTHSHVHTSGVVVITLHLWKRYKKNHGGSFDGSGDDGNDGHDQNRNRHKRGRSPGDNNTVRDPWFSGAQDPWGGSSSSGNVNSKAPRQCGPKLSAQAPEFYPSNENKMLGTISLDELVTNSMQDGPHISVELYNAQRLLEKQNDTIAFLIAQMNFISEDTMHDTDVLCQLKQIDGSIENLCHMLASSTVRSTLKSANAKMNSVAKHVRPLRDLTPAGACDKDGAASSAVAVGTSAGDCLHQDNSDLENANKMICELRHQNASQVAKAARREDVDSHGRLLQTLVIPSGALSEHFTVGEVFTKFAGAACEVDVREPYLLTEWQLQNLSELVDAFLAETHVRIVRVTTHARSSVNSTWFNKLAAELLSKGVTFSVAFQPELHLRELVFSNGVAILADRGLDLFRAPNSSGLRFCRGTSVFHYELDHKALTQHANIAADIAKEAKSLLVEEASRDLFAIEAMVAESGEKPDNATKHVRETLEGAKVKAWLSKMKYRFTDEGMRVALSDRYKCPAAANQPTALLSSPEQFEKAISEWVEFGRLEKVVRNRRRMNFDSVPYGVR